jgi:hypothetical protein
MILALEIVNTRRTIDGSRATGEGADSLYDAAELWETACGYSVETRRGATGLKT